MNRIFYLLLITIFCWLIAACSKAPYAATNKRYKEQANNYSQTIKEGPTFTATDSIMPAPYWVGTTNFGIRKPNYVIIHHTAQDSCAQTLKTFTLDRTQVSSHYLICEDGTIFHMLNDFLRAQHAGVSFWGGVTDMNSCSIGIEIDNNGKEAFTDAQMNSLLKLLEALKKMHRIPTANFIGHADIAPTRKNDPNVLFPWKQLADKGFGLWYADTTNVQVPNGFNRLQALRIVGYDIKDSVAAIKAFKRHWLQQDNSATLNANEEKILFNVMKQFL
jgi:N-acetylmuramoyl-L-alanine amidase